MSIFNIFKRFIHNNTVNENEPSWGSVDKTKLPRLAYADMGEEGKKSTWRLPHHYIEGGSTLDDKGIYTNGTMYLHRGGLAAAFGALQGARIGQPMNVSAETRAHIMQHREVIMKSAKAHYLIDELTVLKRMNLTDSDILDTYAEYGPPQEEILK